jgi:hypothetical protein
MQRFGRRCVLAALTLAAFVASSLSPVASAQQAGSASHFLANGDSALVEISGDVLVSLNVFRGGTLQNPQTFLYYVVCTRASGLCQQGSGLIPNGDFQADGMSRRSLNTDTSAAANPSFFRFEGPGFDASGGVISLVWDRTSFFSRSGHSSLDVKFGNSSHLHQNSHADTVSATATGSVLGVPLGVIGGEIGSQHGSTIDICKLC